MSLNDSLATALSVINNNEQIGIVVTTVKPVSKVMKSIFSIMKYHQYLGEVKDIETSQGKAFEINLLGTINKCGAIKPRFAVGKNGYEKYEKRYLPAKGIGLLFISTPHGILTHHEAKKKNTGGRLIAYVY